MWKEGREEYKYFNFFKCPTFSKKKERIQMQNKIILSATIIRI